MRSKKNKKSQYRITLIWFTVLTTVSFLILQRYDPKFLRITTKSKVGINIQFDSPQIYHFANKNKNLEKNIINLKINTKTKTIAPRRPRAIQAQTATKESSRPANWFKSIPGALSFSKGRQTKIIISSLYYSKQELQSCTTQCLLQARDNLGYSIDLSFFKIAHIKNFSKIVGDKITVSGVIRNNKLFLSEVSQPQ
jgi:hypothetical protein